MKNVICLSDHYNASWSTHKRSFLLSRAQARRQHVGWAYRLDFLDAAELRLQQELIEITNYLFGWKLNCQNLNIKSRYLSNLVEQPETFQSLFINISFIIEFLMKCVGESMGNLLTMNYEWTRVFGIIKLLNNFELFGHFEPFRTFKLLAKSKLFKNFKLFENFKQFAKCFLSEFNLKLKQFDNQILSTKITFQATLPE